MRYTIMLASLLLSACATLPATETAAFKTLADADRDAFNGAAVAERDAVAALAFDQVVAGAGAITSTGCGPGDTARTCDLTLAAGGRDFALVVQAPQGRRLIGSIADYGAAMADLAAARDLAELNANIDGVANAVAGLGAAVGIGAPLAVIAKLTAAGLKGNFQARRRQLLFAAAEQAQPLIARAVVILGGQAEALKGSMTAAALPRLSTADRSLPELRGAIGAATQALRAAPPGAAGEADRLRSLAALSALQSRAGALVRDQYAAAAQINAARAIDADFSSLATGHAAVLGSLRSAGDPVAGIAELTNFVDLLAELKAAL